MGQAARDGLGLRREDGPRSYTRFGSRCPVWARRARAPRRHSNADFGHGGRLGEHPTTAYDSDEPLSPRTSSLLESLADTNRCKTALRERRTAELDTPLVWVTPIPSRDRRSTPAAPHPRSDRTIRSPRRTTYNQPSSTPRAATSPATPPSSADRADTASRSTSTTSRFTTRSRPRARRRAGSQSIRGCSTTRSSNVPVNIVTSPRGVAEAIHLVSIAPPVSIGITSKAKSPRGAPIVSTATHVGGSIAEDVGAIRLSAGYNDYRPLRIATSSIGREHGSGYQRLALIGPRAPLRPQETTPSPCTAASTSIDCSTSHAPISATSRSPMIAFRSRARIRARQYRTDAVVGALLFSGNVRTQRWTAGILSVLGEETATSALRPCDALDVSQLGFAHAFEDRHRTRALRRESKITGATRSSSVTRAASTDTSVPNLRFGIVTASALVAIVHAKTESEVAQSFAQRHAPRLASVRRFDVFGPSACASASRTRRTFATVQDLRDAITDLLPSSSRSRSTAVHRSTREKVGSKSSDFTPSSKTRSNRRACSRESSSTIANVRLTGSRDDRWPVTSRIALRVGGALTWTEGREVDTDAPVVTFPSFTGRASVRYDFREYDAFVERTFADRPSPFTRERDGPRCPQYARRITVGQHLSPSHVSESRVVQSSPRGSRISDPSKTCSMHRIARRSARARSRHRRTRRAVVGFSSP